MPEIDSIGATRRSTSIDVPTRILILTAFGADDNVPRALRASASGFLLKDAPRQSQVASVRAVAAGEPPWNGRSSRDCLAQRLPPRAQLHCRDMVRGPIAARLRNLGLRSGVGAPVVVDGILRAAFVIGSALPMPADTEARIVDFADLVATAIFNAETRAEITASRARIVAAADHARRGFERDLHDGAQQRIVSLGLQLRGVESALPAELTDVREQLNRTVEGLGALVSIGWLSGSNW